MIPHLHQTVFLYYPYIYKSVFGRFLLLQLSKVLHGSRTAVTLTACLPSRLRICTRFSVVSQQGSIALARCALAPYALAPDSL